MNNKQIVVCGSLAFDYIMQFDGDFNDNLTSDKSKKVFNLAVMPSTKTINFGGTAGNISYNLVQFGTNISVMTAIGKDFKDLGYLKHFKKHSNIEFIGNTYEDQFTASCYIVNDKNHNQIIIFHQGAMANSPSIKLKEKNVTADNTCIISISPDNYLAMINWAHEAIELNVPFILDPGQVTPAFSEGILKELIPKAKLLIGNEFEINMILKKLNTDINGLLKLNPTIIITKGAKGSTLYDNEKIIEIPVIKTEKVIDTTGAGDGYRAGLLFGLANGLSLTASCQIGAVTGSFVVETEGPQTQEFNLEKIKNRFEQSFSNMFQI